MESRNVDIVRRSCEAAIRGDLDTAVGDQHADVEIIDTDIPDAGHYRGRDGYFRWLAQWSESFSAWSLEDLEYREGPDDRVVVLFDLRATGKGSGAEVTRGDAMVCTVGDGQITEIVYYNDQARALAEAGLA